MSIYRKCLISSLNVRLVTSFVLAFLVFAPFCVYASADLCTRVFGPNSHPFYEYLFGKAPEDSAHIHEVELSVTYAGHNPETSQIGFRRKKVRTLRQPHQRQTLNWQSYEKVDPRAQTPQGDLRNFIYLAGQELAQRFGFEFRVEGNEVVLLIPDAERIERTVKQLNEVLIARGQEPISYLPWRTGFSKLGETLELSNSSEHPIEVRFPYADLDPQLAAHEVSYHLGALLFGNQLMKKASAINHEFDRVITWLEKSKLPRASYVASKLILLREGDLDAGTANVQLYLARHRKSINMAPYHSQKWTSFDSALENLALLAHPYYTPSEVVAYALMHLSGNKKFFRHLPEFQRDMDLRFKASKYNWIDPVDMEKADQASYLVVIRNLLNSQQTNPTNQVVPARQNGGVWLMELQMGMEKRIKQLLDAFEAIGK